MLLAELKIKSARLFENPIEKLPEPPVLLRDKLHTYHKANLDNQISLCKYDIKCWQAKELGFQEVDSFDIVKMLTGYKPTHAFWKNTYARDLIGYRRSTYLPPYELDCIAGPLSKLIVEIPCGVVLRIEEIKKLGLFDVIRAYAPAKAWDVRETIDPIITGRIFAKGIDVVKEFFIAQW